MGSNPGRSLLLLSAVLLPYSLDGWAKRAPMYTFGSLTTECKSDRAPPSSFFTPTWCSSSRNTPGNDPALGATPGNCGVDFAWQKAQVDDLSASS